MSNMCREQSTSLNLEAKIARNVFGKDCLIFSLTGEYFPATMFITLSLDLDWKNEAGRGGLIN
jgi:hypothetical protein